MFIHRCRYEMGSNFRTFSDNNHGLIAGSCIFTTQLVQKNFARTFSTVWNRQVALLVPLDSKPENNNPFTLWKFSLLKPVTPPIHGRFCQFRMCYGETVIHQRSYTQLDVFCWYWSGCHSADVASFLPIQKQLLLHPFMPSRGSWIQRNQPKFFLWKRKRLRADGQAMKTNGCNVFFFRITTEISKIV